MFVRHSWDTSDSPAGNEIDFWREAVCEAVFELEVDLTPIQRLSATIEQRPIGPIGGSIIQLNLPQTIHRTKRAIAKSQREQFELVTMQRGNARLWHCGREVTLSPGDSILVDSRRPCDISCTAGSRNSSLHLPVSWVQQWLASPEDVCGRPIDGGGVSGRLISALADAAFLSVHHDDNGSRFADQVGAALALVWDREAAAKAGSEAVFQRAMNRLRTVATDCGLDTKCFAAMLGVSVRYMHKMFASRGTTYGAELLAFRLSVASRMLRDPNFWSLPVSEVAWRAGFADPSHFHRSFRVRFGCTPGAYRARA